MGDGYEKPEELVDQQRCFLPTRSVLSLSQKNRTTAYQASIIACGRSSNLGIGLPWMFLRFVTRPQTSGVSETPEVSRGGASPLHRVHSHQLYNLLY